MVYITAQIPSCVFAVFCSIRLLQAKHHDKVSVGVENFYFGGVEKVQG